MVHMTNLFVSAQRSPLEKGCDRVEMVIGDNVLARCDGRAYGNDNAPDYGGVFAFW